MGRIANRGRRPPKTLTDRAICLMNASCEAHVGSDACDASCDVLGARMGWCAACWQDVFGTVRQEPAESDKRTR